MIKHHYIKRNSLANIKSTDESINRESKDKLNIIAEELVTLARSRLPNHVLRGALSGREDDIRQEAILLAYSWYLRQEKPPDPSAVLEWHAPRAIAAALRIQKLESLRQITRENLKLQAYEEGHATTKLHPTLVHSSEWSASVKRLLLRRAIKQALQCGRISHANAGVTLRVLVVQVAVKTLADQLKVHRSTIYQHMTRVRRVLPDIMVDIEVPYSELF
jgi:hypothetical protein